MGLFQVLVRRQRVNSCLEYAFNGPFSLCRGGGWGEGRGLRGKHDRLFSIDKSPWIILRRNHSDNHFLVRNLSHLCYKI